MRWWKSARDELWRRCEYTKKTSVYSRVATNSHITHKDHLTRWFLLSRASLKSQRAEPRSHSAHWNGKESCVDLLMMPRIVFEWIVSRALLDLVQYLLRCSTKQREEKKEPIVRQKTQWCIQRGKSSQYNKSKNRDRQLKHFFFGSMNLGSLWAIWILLVFNHFFPLFTDQKSSSGRFKFGKDASRVYCRSA